jgi:hypothetical protein
VLPVRRQVSGEHHRRLIGVHQRWRRRCQRAKQHAAQLGRICRLNVAHDAHLHNRYKQRQRYRALQHATQLGGTNRLNVTHGAAQSKCTSHAGGQKAEPERPAAHATAQQHRSKLTSPTVLTCKTAGL